jgi:hypothetical protein
MFTSGVEARAEADVAALAGFVLVRQVQNYIVNLQVNYNISRASDLPTTLSPSGQDFCPQAHYFLFWFRGSAPGKSLPSRPLSCLLLKPISAHYAHCPICSPYRPTRAFVLSGYIDSVSIAAIIYHVPQLKLLRVTLPGLPSQQGQPYLAGVAPYTLLARQRTHTFPSY